jgi:uncharacterized repeat protein (TIGR01451 family)
MKKIFLTIGLATLMFGLSVANVSAYQYGDDDSGRQIIVDKKIKAVGQNYWHDNLYQNDILLTAEDLVFFKIFVKNTGDETLHGVTLIDYLPNYTNYILSDGKLNTDKNRVEWSIGDLEAGKEKEYYLRVQIEDSKNLPSDEIYISINKAKVDSDSGESDEDSAEFPIATTILAKKLPESGNSQLPKVIAAALIGGIGVIARKFGRGEI